MRLRSKSTRGFTTLLLALTLNLNVWSTAQAQGLDLPDFPWRNSGEFGLGTVIEGSMNLDCLAYCFTGICVSLVCKPCPPFGICCTIHTSPQVTHWMPDFVVSSYNTRGDISWTEAKETLGVVAADAAIAILGTLIKLPDYAYGGMDMRTFQEEQSYDQRTERNQSIFFKEVSVIGNPITAILSIILSYADNIARLGEMIEKYLGSLGYAAQIIQDIINRLWPLIKAITDLASVVEGIPLCPSDVKAFYPYFQSEFDVLTWRFGLPELLYPASWVPGMREIGDWPFNTWGSVHPRQGFLAATEEPKAAGVMAQRAIDVVTREDQPHIYSFYAEAGPSDEDTDKWLMVSPTMGEKCAPFGDPDYSTGGVFIKPLPDGEERTASDGKFGWLYWNEYECCPWKKGILIAVVPIPEICLF